MKKPKAIILRTAGTNCDLETAHAFKLAGAEPERVHVNALIKKRSLLSRYHMLAIPGGFTYGDDIASGKVLANELRSKLKDELLRFIGAGKPIIGICNGFQILVKMGLLPRLDSAKDPKIEATLSLNDSGRFQDRWVYLKTSDQRLATSDNTCIWTRGLPEVIYIPIAHAEGKFIPKDDKVLRALKQNGQVVFRYSDEEGNPAGYPHNPNGSVDNIAGICDPTGRILGLMPHPERHMTYLQHPNWRRHLHNSDKLGTGLKIFENGVNYVKKHL